MLLSCLCFTLSQNSPPIRSFRHGSENATQPAQLHSSSLVRSESHPEVGPDYLLGDTVSQALPSPATRDVLPTRIQRTTRSVVIKEFIEWIWNDVYISIVSNSHSVCLTGTDVGRGGNRKIDCLDETRGFGNSSTSLKVFDVIWAHPFPHHRWHATERWCDTVQMPMKRAEVAAQDSSPTRM